MIKLLKFAALILSIAYLNGCNRDEIINPPSEVNAFNGAYILSEGGFSAGSSRLSFYNLADDVFTENITSNTLGLFPDGLILDDKELFLCEQGNFGSTGRVYRMDTNGVVKTFQSVGTNPFSLASANEKLYLTNGPANNVSVVDKNNLNIITTVNVGLFPQEIISIGNKVFVCNTSFGGATDSTVSVIDAVSDQVIHSIIVRKTPSSLEVTNDGKLLIGCPGSTATGIIYKFDPGNYSKLDSFVIGNGLASGFDKDISVDRFSNNIYFISNLNNIVKLDLATKSHSIFISNQNTSTTFFYGYNYDNVNKKHYVADAKSFVINGSINIYDENGNSIRTFTTGIAPRRIVIKN